jgi:hypothetical protein
LLFHPLQFVFEWFVTFRSAQITFEEQILTLDQAFDEIFGQPSAIGMECTAARPNAAHEIVAGYEIITKRTLNTCHDQPFLLLLYH